MDYKKQLIEAINTLNISGNVNEQLNDFNFDKSFKLTLKNDVKVDISVCRNRVNGYKNNAKLNNEVVENIFDNVFIILVAPIQGNNRNTLILDKFNILEEHRYDMIDLMLNTLDVKKQQMMLSMCIENVNNITNVIVNTLMQYSEDVDYKLFNVGLSDEWLELAKSYSVSSKIISSKQF